jgi:hypothetical protein
MQIAKIAAVATLLLGSASFAFAQAPSTPPTTGTDSPSKSQPGAPEQGPAKQAPGASTGTRPLGPPANPAEPAPGNNPTGVTKEKEKSTQEDPQSGGMKK